MCTKKGDHETKRVNDPSACGLLIQIISIVMNASMGKRMSQMLWTHTNRKGKCEKVA